MTKSKKGSESASETGETVAIGIALIAKRIVTKMETRIGR